jgi:DNA polymerase-4
MKRFILHVDMNSYFASVEQQANPFLRGKSIGVCAYLSPNGAIIASSVEAKAKGIRTASRVVDAKVLDPHIILVANEPAKYRTVTTRIFSILKEYTDNFEPYSIDEAFIDVTNAVNSFEDAAKIGEEIRQRIFTEVGEWLKCSIGISWTKFLAKFAGDTAPKGGTKIISPENLATSLDCPVTEAWGIAKGLERRLQLLGIRTLDELRLADAIRLKKNLGIVGYYLWANVNGQEISVVTKGATPPKSIGHSYCLPKQTTDHEYLDKVLYKLCEKTGRRLREKQLEAGRLSLHLSLRSGESFQQSETVVEHLFTTEEIFALALKHFQKMDLTAAVRMMAISVSRLSPVTGQLSLFTTNTRGRSVTEALDIINDKYGEYTVMKGAMFGTTELAHDRIGFRKTISFVED